MEKNNSFSNKYKLKKKKDLNNLRSGSQRFSSKYFRYFFKSNGLTYSRLAISASKKNGMAVFRNKLKRLAREEFRNSIIKQKGIDILLVFHPNLKITNFELEKDKLKRKLMEAWSGEIK